MTSHRGPPAVTPRNLIRGTSLVRLPMNDGKKLAQNLS